MQTETETPAIDRISPEEIEQLKAEAAAELERQRAEAATPKVEEKDKTTAPRQGRGGAPVNPKSIRQTVMRMLGEGKATKEIAEVLKSEFPGTAAAAKSDKHIAFYRAKMRQDGTLPKYQRADA